MRSRVVRIVWGFAVMALLSQGAIAQTSAKRFQARIVDGIQTSSHPEVGALIIDTPDGLGFCSGTMIGCDSFITAAHCVCSGLESAADCRNSGAMTAAADLRVYLPNAGIFKGTSVSFNNDYVFATGADVAVIKLATPMTGVAPARINTIGHPQPGSRGDLVGYGLDGKAFAVGLKRFGKVSIGTCESVPDDKNLCWKFDTPIDAPGEDSNTCNGDSGGPLFVDFGSGDVLAGVTSGGRVGCHPPDESFDTDIFANRDFITGAAGDDLDNARCGDVPHVGEAGAEVTQQRGTLTNDVRDAHFAIEVPPSTALLRIGLNGESHNEFVRNDFDLAVSREAPATLQHFDCKDDSPLSYAFCDVSAPAAGTWDVLVHSVRGSGKFQLTATTFSSSANPAVCTARSNVAMGELVAAVDLALTQSSAGPRVASGQGDDGAVAVEHVIRATNAALAVCQQGS